MSEIFILSSIPEQGKTTTALLLEKQLKDEGKRVACLQNNKGQNDVGLYLKKGAFHYTIPLEATQGKAAFERWVPRGYDSYIMEITMPYSPFGAAYVDLFQNVNEVISFDVRHDWRSHVSDSYSKLWNRSKHGIGRNQDLMAFWDLVHERNNKILLTKTPTVVDGPCVDTTPALHHADELVSDTVNPRMEYPKSSKDVIAFGAFPGEFWDIFPSLKWFGYDPCGFQRNLKKGDYDMAIIGQCKNQDLKFSVQPENTDCICYQPNVYLDLKKMQLRKPLTGDYPAILSTIKNQKPGTPVCPDGEPYCGYNNRFWVHRKFENTEPVWKERNIVYCDGWVLPQYLIKEGLLEV